MTQVKTSESLNKRSQKSTSKAKFYEIINSEQDKKSSVSLQEDDKTIMWLDNKDLLCNCPKIRLRRKYLIMTRGSNLLKYITQAEQGKSQENTDENIQLNYDLDDDDIEITLSANKTSVKQTPASTTQKTVIETTNTDRANNKLAGILLDRDTFIIEWRNDMAKRLRRFVKYFQNGKCS